MMYKKKLLNKKFFKVKKNQICPKSIDSIGDTLQLTNEQKVNNLNHNGKMVSNSNFMIFQQLQQISLLNNEFIKILMNHNYSYESNLEVYKIFCNKNKEIKYTL